MKLLDKLEVPVRGLLEPLRPACASILPTLFLATIALGPLSGQQPIPCYESTSQEKGGCTLTEFDRPANWIGDPGVHRPKGKPPSNVLPPTTDFERLAKIWTINSPAAKILYSGTILSVPYEVSTSFEKTCEGSDWKVVLLSDESSNVLTYGPADISESCRKDNQGNPKGVLLVVPVTVKWAQVFRYDGNKLDPLRKPTPGVSASSYCGIAFDPPAHQLPQPIQPGSDTPGGIQPCDVSKHEGIYDSRLGKLYNLFTQPGAAQGAISITPAIGSLPPGGMIADKPKETLNFDVQLYPSVALPKGPGWIGFPIVFEKANAATASLDSLTAAISYDIPLSAVRPDFLHSHSVRDTGTVRLSIKPPDFRIQYGLEFAPGGQLCASGLKAPYCGASAPHDLNLVAAASLRMPIVLDFHKQPSALTIFPVVGLEGGTHVQTRLPEPDDIFRKVAGFDSSARIPFILTHQFLGDKPMTLEFGWRTRYLSYREPFSDFVSGRPEVLTKQQRSYWRGSFIIPASTYVQFKVTVQHGGLPPDFDYLGYSLNIGLTFLNPGYSEH